jgi:hypothetical protein
MQYGKFIVGGIFGRRSVWDEFLIAVDFGGYLNIVQLR